MNFPPATIDEKVILIRINRLYSNGMSACELYEATRGVWRLRKNRVEKVTYAFAVFKGIVKEVYKIQKWHKAGTLEYKTRDYEEFKYGDSSINLSRGAS